MMQKVISQHGFKSKTLKIKAGENISIGFLIEILTAYGFQRVDFVYEPGQFSVRGGIVDVFSFAFELPYRLDFFGDEVETIRIFDIETQLSQDKKQQIEIVPDLHKSYNDTKYVSFPEFVSGQTWFHFTDVAFVRDRINQLYDDALVKANTENKLVENLYATHITGHEFLQHLTDYRKPEWGNKSFFKAKQTIHFNTSPQPVFQKNFELISNNLKKNIAEGYKIFIFSDSVKQTDRIAAIFKDRNDEIVFQPVKNTIHEGFVDHDLSLVCYTDHQIFDRFHKYQLKTDKTRQGKVVMTLKELNQLQFGDFVVHVDHGVGKFGGW